MISETEEHGFARRKTDATPSEHARSTVDDTPADNSHAVDSPAVDSSGQDTPSGTALIDDGTPEDALETDASDADQVGATFSARRARPLPPQRPETRPIPIVTQVERYRAPVEADVFDVDATPPRRRRDDVPYPQSRRRRRRRSRAGWIAATVIFFLLFGSAAALDWYLWNTTSQWEERAAQLTEVNYDLGARLSSEQQTTMQLNAEIDLLTQQLASSNQKVTDLSAEKASAVDESASYLQQIDGLSTSLSNASGVANALHRCVDGQQELVTYLSDAENYEAEDLEAFGESVRELCAAAEAGNDRLQEALRP